LGAESKIRKERGPKNLKKNLDIIYGRPLLKNIF
jgi:hypothetical protein